MEQLIDTLEKEAITLTKWLVSIPSVAHTRGQQIIIQAIYDGISSFTYFQNNKDNLHYISHDDQQNSSLIAVIEAKEPTQNTILLVCNVDTAGTEKYGILKPYAFKGEELYQKLKANKYNEKITKDLNTNDFLYGLGIYESKAVTGCFIALLKEFADNYEKLDTNIIFICNTCLYDNNQGIKACIPYLNDIKQKKNFKFVTALCIKPQNHLSDKSTNNVYTANLGLLEPCFYILGEGSDLNEPFNGFSSTIISSFLMKNIELNSNIIFEKEPIPLNFLFNALRYKNYYNGTTPDAVLLSFKMPFFNIRISDILDTLKDIAAKAIEESANLIDSNKAHFYHILKQDYDVDIKDAEILSFADLFRKAQQNYDGNLKSAIDALLHKCLNDHFDRYQTFSTIIERLNELAHLPRPSIVVFFGDTFTPKQNLNPLNKEDREVLMKVNEVITNLKETHNINIKLSNLTVATEGAFFRPVGLDVALNTLDKECPVPLNDFYNLEVNTVTLDILGEDLFYPTERIRKSEFRKICAFVLELCAYKHATNNTLVADPTNTDKTNTHDTLIKNKENIENEDNNLDTTKDNRQNNNSPTKDLLDDNTYIKEKNISLIKNMLSDSETNPTALDLKQDKQGNSIVKGVKDMLF